MQSIVKIRTALPRLGVRKLHYMLQDNLNSHGITIGRDYLFDLLAQHKLLVRQRKRKIITTNSRHWMKKYFNLTKNIEITRPEQLWVSDITYIRLNNQWGYLSLITDAYSRKIMGYGFRNDLSTKGCLDALHMALNNRKNDLPLIHHSDRGSQYCSTDYVTTLINNKIAISMTENGDPYENALAERVNGIIKNEFGLYSSQMSFEQTALLVERSIEAYNQLKPHGSCDYLTPEKVHSENSLIKKRWKQYPKKFTFEKDIV